ncbi:MAG: HAMP domain-containing protein [Anaerolineae bacterium]|nr:HAMP domain-containing protein [Anaerolineae bacterium]
MDKDNNRMILTVGRKLFIGFSIMIFLALTIGVIGLISLGKIRGSVQEAIASDTQVAALANKIAIDLLDMQQDTADFFESANTVEFAEVKAHAYSHIDELVANVEQYVAEGAALERAGGYEDDALLLESINTLTGDFRATFFTVAPAVEQLGDGDSGLEGEMNAVMESIEARIANQGLEQLQIDLFLIQQNEIEFTRRGNSTAVDELAQMVEQFKQDTTFVHTYVLTNEEKDALFASIDNYHELFQQYVDLTTDIQVSMNTLSENIAAIQATDMLVREDAEGDLLAAIEGINRTISTATTLKFLSMLGVTAVGFAIAIILTRRISEPITQFSTIATELAAGDLTKQVEVTSKDEIGVLATAFNRMVLNLKQRIEAEASANELLQNTVVEYAAFLERVGGGDLDSRLRIDDAGERTPLTKLGHIINESVDNIQQQRIAEQEQQAYIANFVDEYLRFITQVKAGNLSTRLSLNGGSDALTVLGHNLNDMVDKISEITAQIRKAALNITDAATEILAAANEQSASASEQSSAISQTTATIDEVKTIAEQAFNRAESVAELAQRTNEVSQAGQVALAHMLESMSEIKERVESIAENILDLSGQTQQIGEITATVNEIASQSNLLALNASVEAARAGEHGKGFAVVAVEVRNLAEQSKQATAQVKAILNEIQRATNAAVMATEEGTKGVDYGVQLTDQASATMEHMTESIGESASAALQIVASSHQQATGMEQIALAMQNINYATMQNLAATNQTEKAARELAALAQQMEGLVDHYKLREE